MMPVLPPPCFFAASDKYAMLLRPPLTALQCRATLCLFFYFDAYAFDIIQARLAA